MALADSSSATLAEELAMGRAVSAVVEAIGAEVASMRLRPALRLALPGPAAVDLAAAAETAVLRRRLQAFAVMAAEAAMRSGRWKILRWMAWGVLRGLQRRRCWRTKRAPAAETSSFGRLCCRLPLPCRDCRSCLPA